MPRNDDSMKGSCIQHTKKHPGHCKPNMATHTCCLSNLEMEQEDGEFQVSLGYTVS